MADLVRVRFKNGKEATVGAEYVERWPEDIAEVIDPAKPDSTPESPGSKVEPTPEPTPVQETTVAPIKEKK